MRSTQPALQNCINSCRIAKPSSRIAIQCAAMQALERTLFRSVRRLAQHLVASAARRGALTSLQANYYVRQARMVVDMDLPERDADDAARAADDAVDHLVREANGGSEFFVPGRGEALTAALTRAAREFESDSFDGAELGMAALRRLGRVAARRRELEHAAVEVVG